VTSFLPGLPYPTVTTGGGQDTRINYNSSVMEIAELKDANFFSFLASSPVPVMAIFHIPASKPATEELATVRDLAQSYDGVVRFASVNANECPHVVDFYGILSVPTILLLRKQKAIDRIVGIISREALAERLEEDLRKIV